ncbi:TPA: hypothetical protein N0F65_008571 [Lagenidium giganteum]|uniref:Odorant receptor n=1 Tax=Lagenidium giganteum TaxID=4803 RepID=A0AAV2YGL0_9STRA|nr:TPA: hypothetical protein N0F65_008571 [Lagenidium giganteum]
MNGNAKQWRDEDLAHRRQVKQWREDALQRELVWRNDEVERERRLLKLQNEKRAIEARCRQLTMLSQICARLAFISMVSIVEINLPETLNHALIFIYGTVLCMLLCMLACLMLLLAATQFATHTLEEDVRALDVADLTVVSPFSIWWLKKCEDSWLSGERVFRWGVGFFYVEIVVLGWVQFAPHSLATAVTITVICTAFLLYYQTQVVSKWRYLAKFPEPPAYTVTQLTPAAETSGGHSKQWRDEDVAHQQQLKQWREIMLQLELMRRNEDLEHERRLLKLQNEQRSVEARCRQLRTLSQICATLALISMVSIVEIDLPETPLNHALIFTYGTVCSIEVLCMLLCMLVCMMLLLATAQFTNSTLEGDIRALDVSELSVVSPFSLWWLKTCEDSWLLSERAFRWGYGLTYIQLVVLSWVQFGKHSLASVVTITVVCTVFLVYYHTYVVSKWRYLAKFPTAPVSNEMQLVAEVEANYGAS